MKIEEAIKQKGFKSEYQKLFINIIYTANWLNNETLKVLKPFKISPQQYNVLRILKGQYPKSININNIISRMLDKNSNASRLVDKLKLKGLIERGTCNNDRRQVDIKITKNGIDLLNVIAIDMLELNNFSNSITVDEAVLFNDILDRVRK